MVTPFDFSPLFRTAIGFDRMSRALDAAARVDDSALSYPPYNIERLDDDHYRVEMAVAGFTRDDLEIVLHEGTLTVKSKAAHDRDEGRQFLYRGIATRSFERHFHLAEHIRVRDATLENGMLRIELQREVPEELRPRKIDIKSGSPKTIEGRAA